MAPITYVTGLLTAAKPPPVQSFSLYSVLADLENRLQNPGNVAHVAAAKAQLFGCLHNQLDVAPPAAELQRHDTNLVSCPEISSAGVARALLRAAFTLV
jgi:hypothetical protein